MATSGIIGEALDKQAALASAALQNISDAGASVERLRPRMVLDMLGPYAAALYIAERVVESEVFNAELDQALLSKLLPLGRMADDTLAAARQGGYFDDPETAEPLQWLETCNEQVKDCIVALESSLEPGLDGLMEATLKEHQQGETVPLDSIT